MQSKKRKLTHKERLSHFKANPKWKVEVQKFETAGHPYDEALVMAMNHNNVPTHGQTVIRGTTAVKVL